MILLEFLLVTLSQCKLFKTWGGGGKAAGLGAETEGRVVYLFIFSPLNRLR